MEINPVILLALNRLPGTDGWKKFSLAELIPEFDNFADAVDYYYSNYQIKQSLPEPDELLESAEREYRKLKILNIKVKILGRSDYPALLSLIKDPPFILYYRGEDNFGTGVPAAVVGTRKPDLGAHREAFKLSFELAESGYPVVSGLAFGIDCSAHTGALASGGRTWAVLAGGLERPSPSANRKLAWKIMDNGGTLIGEIPPGSFPGKYAFPRRNRILSGLCRATVVVQAPEKSGALITAEYAVSQNRDVFVGSAGISGPVSGGTALMAEQGAPVISSASEIIMDWGLAPPSLSLKVLGQPETPEELSRRMLGELEGTVFMYKGEWYEQRSA